MPKKFEYFKDGYDRPQFECQLQKIQCDHINPSTGHRCRRFSVIGVGLCYQHLATDRHLKIKPSTIPDAGLGLFAYNKTNDGAIIFRGPRNTPYGKTTGDFIVEYRGQYLPRREIDRRYGDGTAPYGADINKRFVVDGACMRSAGSLANHKPHSKANARLVSNRTLSVRLEATKPIRNGDEIFVDYGPDYLMDDGYSYRTKNVRN